MSITKEQLQNCIIDKYGDFHLTDGIRTLDLYPKQGFKHYKNKEFSAVVASISKEILLEIFYEMLDLLENGIYVILCSSHDKFLEDGCHEYWREGIDKSVLESILIDYEDLMLNDGLFEISIFDENKNEIQFDGHKALVGYGCVDKFDQIFEMHGLVCDESLQLIQESSHVHLSEEKFYDKFLDLKIDLGME